MGFESKEQVIEYATKRREICKALKEMIVEQLSLSLEPEFITDDQPLFGRGLELDSIDALELAIGIYNIYELTLSDGETKVFSSVNTMADYVIENFGKQDGGLDIDSLEGDFDDITDFDE